MNRRSILTSLSSMCLAALAWPRNAAGGGGRTNLTIKVPKAIYKIKVKNAFVGEGGKLIPGSSTLDVWAYSDSQITTLTGGDVRLYQKQLDNDPGQIKVEISAAFPEEPIQKTSIEITQKTDTTLYFLAYADSLTRTRRITITKAPPGVTF
jgi:hypothetical protein